MRTTVELDDDTAKAVQELRRERGMGLSEAVNELVRRGLVARDTPPAFRQRSGRFGIKIDVSNVAEALEVLEGVEGR